MQISWLAKTNIHSSVSHLSTDKHISLLQNNGRKFVGSRFWESVNNSNHAQRITSYFPSFKTLQPDDEHKFAAVFLFQTVTSFIVHVSLTTLKVYLKRSMLRLFDKWHLISPAHCLRQKNNNKEKWYFQNNKQIPIQMTPDITHSLSEEAVQRKVAFLKEH